MRTTVRGRFAELDVSTVEYLRSNQEFHDVSRAEYTTEGTLTFDSLIDFFSIRHEIRLGENDPDSLAHDFALKEVERFLVTMGFGYRGIKTVVIDMASVRAKPNEMPVRPQC